MIKIAFCEYKNPVISEAIKRALEKYDFSAVEAENLSAACLAVKSDVAQALIAGIDYTSREVILACRDIIGKKDETFSGSFLFTKEGQKLLVGDAAACKNPDVSQLIDITRQTYESAKILLNEEPRVALLSFSTFGSGGKDVSIDRAKMVIEKLRKEIPEILIDGEMQLDTAVNPVVAAKKAPDSLVAGKANVLIAPDLNAGNILYKSLEQFGGFTAAGPILQGFMAPASDLSRGSTVEDVMSVIEVMIKLAENHG